MEQSTRTSYRLPGGGYTKSIRIWEAEWNKLFKPFEELGYVVHAFDPGIRMSKKDAPDHAAHVTITVDFAKTIGDALQGRAAIPAPVVIQTEGQSYCDKRGCPSGQKCRTPLCDRLDARPGQFR
jgi:hypothetical protein